MGLSIPSGSIWSGRLEQLWKLVAWSLGEENHLGYNSTVIPHPRSWKLGSACCREQGEKGFQKLLPQETFSASMLLFVKNPMIPRTSREEKENFGTLDFYYYSSFFGTANTLHYYSLSFNLRCLLFRGYLCRNGQPWLAFPLVAEQAHRILEAIHFWNSTCLCSCTLSHRRLFPR